MALAATPLAYYGNYVAANTLKDYNKEMAELAFPHAKV
jgi:hypothetical protein